MGGPTITAKNGAATWGQTTVTITAGVAKTVTLNNGRRAIGRGHSPFTNPLVVTVTDSFGNPVSALRRWRPAARRPEPALPLPPEATAPRTRTLTHAWSPREPTARPPRRCSRPTPRQAITTSPLPSPAPPPRGLLQRDEHRRRSPAKVAITPTPASAADSATTNVTLGYQLEDAFNNPTTNTTGATISLTVGSSSAKGFFCGCQQPTRRDLGRHHHGDLRREPGDGH